LGVCEKKKDLEKNPLARAYRTRLLTKKANLIKSLNRSNLIRRSNSTEDNRLNKGTNFGPQRVRSRKRAI